jgi:predicted PurR-regulated permease PerM
VKQWFNGSDFNKYDTYLSIKKPKFLYAVYKFLFILLLAYSLLRTIISLFYLALLEIFILKPVVFFLWATQKDRGVKAYSFLLLLLGFLTSLLFSY